MRPQRNAAENILAAHTGGQTMTGFNEAAA